MITFFLFWNLPFPYYLDISFIRFLSLLLIWCFLSWKHFLSALGLPGFFFSLWVVDSSVFNGAATAAETASSYSTNNWPSKWGRRKSPRNIFSSKSKYQLYQSVQSIRFNFSYSLLSCKLENPLSKRTENSSQNTLTQTKTFDADFRNSH